MYNITAIEEPQLNKTNFWLSLIFARINLNLRESI